MKDTIVALCRKCKKEEATNNEPHPGKFCDDCRSGLVVWESVFGTQAAREAREAPFFAELSRRIKRGDHLKSPIKRLLTRCKCKVLSLLKKTICRGCKILKNH